MTHEEQVMELIGNCEEAMAGLRAAVDRHELDAAMDNAVGLSQAAMSLAEELEGTRVA